MVLFTLFHESMLLYQTVPVIILHIVDVRDFPQIFVYDRVPVQAVEFENEGEILIKINNSIKTILKIFKL